MPDYPRREKFYANKFIRLLTKSCAAQEIGSDACWMLTVIAMQEDVKRYKGAVTYYNGQLMPLCAFESEGRLIRARQRAVDSGWLHYEQGAKRKPGRYWTQVPETSIDLPDSPMDESDSNQIHLQIESANRSESDIHSQIESANGNTNEGNPKGIRSANGGPSYPIPIPGPSPKNIDISAELEKRLASQLVLSLPAAIDSERNRKQLRDWLMVRLVNHKDRLPVSQASWEATLMGRASWDEPRWFRSLLKSTEAGSLGLIDPKPERIDPDDPANWPEGQTCRAKPLTADEIKDFKWT